MTEKMKHEVTCTKCGHTWNTKGKARLVTCPACGLKTPNVANVDPEVLGKALEMVEAEYGKEAADFLRSKMLLSVSVGGSQ